MMEKKEFETGNTVMTVYGEGRIVDVIRLASGHKDYLVAINDIGTIWFGRKDLKRIDENDTKSDTKAKEKYNDDIVERFDKVGKVIEKTIPLIGYIFFSAIVSLFVLCIVIFMFGAIGIMQVNYKVLSALFLALYIFATYITFIIFGKKR